MKIWFHHFKLLVALAQYFLNHQVSQQCVTNQYDLRTFLVFLFHVATSMMNLHQVGIY